MIYFICPTCDLKTRWKGLCRECTTYDDNGNIINAVRRVKEGVHVHDENCNHDHEHPPSPKIQISKDDFVNARRRKPTKKQRDKFNKILEDAQFSGTIDEAREVLINASDIDAKKPIGQQFPSQKVIDNIKNNVKVAEEE